MTWLTRNGVMLQPASQVGALTRLDADYVRTWWQLGLKHDNDFRLSLPTSKQTTKRYMMIKRAAAATDAYVRTLKRHTLIQNVDRHPRGR